ATGGYVYDRLIVDGLVRLGWSAQLRQLPDDFPRASDASLAAADALLDSIPAGRIVVVDGLALADLAAHVERHAARLKLVCLVHHPVGDETGLDPDTARRLGDAERRAWHAARGVIVTSPWTARQLAARGLDGARLRVVEPGTDSSRLSADRAEDHHAEPATPPLLLCVATLTPRKGHAVLLDALARLRDKAWRLDCVGTTERDPSTAAAVRNQAKRL